MTRLTDQKIILGVTGSIAAYKSPEVARLLIREGAKVRVVMTKAAQQFITPLTMQAVTNNVVRTDMFDAIREHSIEHIELARWANLVLIAPASAGIASRIAYATASDLLSTLCLATSAPIAMAPAMNCLMWNNWAVKNVFQQLTLNGIKLIGPIQGGLVCGETGIGKMADPVDIVNEVVNILRPV